MRSLRPRGKVFIEAPYWPSLCPHPELTLPSGKLCDTSRRIRHSLNVPELKHSFN